MVGTAKRRTSGSYQASGSIIPNTSAQLKYRPFIETGRWAAKGTMPLPHPATIPETFTNVMIHCCKRVLYLDPKIRITLYAAFLFFFSLVADYMPFPRSYFSNSQNFPNQFFVKFSWGWTFTSVGIFMLMTSSVYCARDRKHVRRHMTRLLVSTGIWYVWTTLFATMEEISGRCIYTAPMEAIFSRNRRTCLKTNGKWTSFDISGHSFILIWCVFVIIEESKPIIGWDAIEDHIRNEEHKRKEEGQKTSPETPLSNLSDEEFSAVKSLYKTLGIWPKITVIFLTFLTLVWDIMLFFTACYFHTMIEKVVGGMVAVFMWRITYHKLYKMDTSISPGLPGTGLFKYSNLHPSSTAATSPTKPKPKDIDEHIPTFMGMPLNALRQERQKSTLESIRTVTMTSK